jgi:HSP20 family molecular chaperone IbpA
MWSEACETLARAERMRREFFRPMREPSRRLPAWEPPVDMIETERDVLVLVALPGVDPERILVAIEGGDLVIAGARVLPVELQTAIIHRLELPQGRFERRLALPAGRYGAVRQAIANGCVLIRLAKAGVYGG